LCESLIFGYIYGDKGENDLKRKIIIGILLTLLLTSLSTLAFNIQRVKGWTGTVYIRANGSIDPFDAPISTVDNVTYTLTGNVTADGDGIVVERDNIVINGTGCTVQGTVVYPYTGVRLSGRENVTVRDVQIKNFNYGIRLERYGFMGTGSSNNSISGNNITSNRFGIYLSGGSNNNEIYGNNITDNFYGVFFDYTAENNKVYGNNITNNELGICLDGYISTTYEECPKNNKIYENNIANNTEAGVKLVGLDNIFYYNNFLNNTIVIESEFSSGGTNDPKLSKNILDNGYPSGGNYWSNYTGVDICSGSDQNETGSDGISDTVHEIDANNTDRYPLMAPFNTFDAGVWIGEAYSVDIISNSTLSNFKLDEAQKMLSFNVTGTEGKDGFCRITIPNIIVHDLWQGNYTVLLNGEPLSFRNWTDAANTYTYISYTHSELEIVIIPEFPSAIIMPLFMALSIIAIIFTNKKRKNKGATSKAPFL